MTGHGKSKNGRNGNRPLQFGVVIVAAGRGVRAGSAARPKQFRTIAGKTVLAHTVDAFAGVVSPSHVCIVHHRDDEARVHAILSERAHTSWLTAHGGSSRQQSVVAGLTRLIESHGETLTHVMIHDAARPFVSPELILDIMARCARAPSAGVVPALRVADTVKQVEGDHVVRTVERDGMYLAQTPQAFPLIAILDAHQRAARTGADFTDDASIFKWAGQSVVVVPGENTNGKLTYADDFAQAERRLEMKRIPAIPDIRTGHGYDVHILGPGGRLTLCGVEIDHVQTLVGHSDADVGLHALTDALLATCGAGDIGDHFPPSEAQWKDAQSHIFLNHAAELVRKHGGTILNVDVTLIAEAPKIAPHRQAMRDKLAALLTLDVTRCSVKATTNEKVGFVGRGEGIAALATASVHFGEFDGP